MLIINFVEKVKQNKKSLFRRKSEDDCFERYNLRYNNKVFTVVKTSLEINNIELLRLVKSFKGKLLRTNNDEFNEIYSDMLFDTSQYNKRAILSSLKTEVERFSSVCIEDYNFKLTQEIVDIAKMSKKICIIGNENTDLQRFCDYCYLKLGLKVILNDLGFKSDIYLNLSDVYTKEKVFCVFGNKEIVLIPDSEYYACNDSVNKLVELYVPHNDACAALEVKRNNDVCWTVN